MTALHEEHPIEHPKGTEPFDASDVAELSGEVPQWKADDGKLVRTFRFRDFQEAFAFVSRVALLAEAEGHHPDIAISWNEVTLTFWTHTAEGLTRNDFIMAARIDRFA